MYIEMRFKTVPLCSLTLISAISVINFLIEPHQVEGSNGDCGVSKVPSGLIVRGSGFSRGDFPWIVALMQTKNQPVSFFCGGTLISSTFVITGKQIDNSFRFFEIFHNSCSCTLLASEAISEAYAFSTHIRAFWGTQPEQSL